MHDTAYLAKSYCNSIRNYLGTSAGSIMKVHRSDGGHAVAHLVEALRYKSEGRGVRIPIVSLEFFIDIILPAALWPWG